jgi:hypothetical protein
LQLKDDPYRAIDRTFKVAVQFEDGTTAITTGEASTIEEVFVPLYKYVDMPDLGERVESAAFAEARSKAVSEGTKITRENASRGVPSGQRAKTDAQMKQEIISQFIASYRGSCACTFNTDRAGRRCGARSAYGRPGGVSPICYETDITQKMVDDYRKRTKQ